MIKIEVASTTFNEKHGTSGKGKPYSIKEQDAYAHVLGEDGKAAKYPVACKLPLEPDQVPYPLGFYTIDPRAVFVGDFGRLGLGRVRLTPIKAAP